MAALSTSDMSFDKVFYILSEKKEFGQLAEDAKQIYRLLKHYSVGAAEACRFVAQRTSSQIESDFFQRLSHSLDVGEKLDRFMHNEHDVMMDEYMLKSESALKDLDFVKEIYTGITTSLIFTAVFVAITPDPRRQGHRPAAVRRGRVVRRHGGLLHLFPEDQGPQGQHLVRLACQDETGLRHRQATASSSPRSLDRRSSASSCWPSS